MQQQEGRAGLILAQYALSEEFDVDQGDHQRCTGAHRGGKRGQERAELHPPRFDQPGCGEPLPHRERDRGQHGATHQCQTVIRQNLLTVRVGVVEAPHGKAECDRKQHAPDHVDAFGFVAALVRREADVDQPHGDQREWHVDPEHVAPGVEQPDHADAVERSEHAAQFLGRADTTQHCRATAGGPQIGRQSQCHRQ